MQTTHRKIVIDDAVPYAKEIFGHLGEVHLLPGKSIDHQTVQDAHALIIRSRTQINAQLLENTSVQFVGSTVVGLDHVDQAFLKNQGIAFFSAQGCNANSVAEFVINALFEVAHAKNLSLQGKTLGVIGAGNVGSRLIAKAEKLGMECFVNDPPKQRIEPQAHHYCTLEKALTADIISVHTPLTFDGDFPTWNLIDAQKLAQIQPQQILINAARGGIINESAWIHTQTLANIIDCWENEPFINEALYQTAFFATPHIAGHSFEAKLAGSTMVYQAYCDFLKQPTQQTWQHLLPSPDFAIDGKQLLKENSANSLGTQDFLRNLFKKCHDIFQDHQGICAKTHNETEKKYEFFRRNYPIYHEWQQHCVSSTGDAEVDKLLKSLGFNLK